MGVSTTFPAASSQVYTPRSGYFWWTLAKIYLNTADGIYCEMIHHLVNSHFVSEAFSVAAYHSFSDSHPIYSILKPHFDGLVGTNTAAFQMLISQRGAIAVVTSVGLSGGVQLVRLGYEDWHFNKTDFLLDLKVWTKRMFVIVHENPHPKPYNLRLCKSRWPSPSYPPPSPRSTHSLMTVCQHISCPHPV